MPNQLKHRLEWRNSGTDIKWETSETEINKRIQVQRTVDHYHWFIDSKFVLLVEEYEEKRQGFSNKLSTPLWFNHIRSFHFKGKNGEYTARKEERGKGILYWYAFRRLGSKVKKLYIGKTEELTISQLEAVASRLTAIYKDMLVA